MSQGIFELICKDCHQSIREHEGDKLKCLPPKLGIAKCACGQTVFTNHSPDKCWTDSPPEKDAVNKKLQEISDQVGDIIRVAKTYGGVLWSTKESFTEDLEDLVALARQSKGAL